MSRTKSGGQRLLKRGRSQSSKDDSSGKRKRSRITPKPNLSGSEIYYGGSKKTERERERAREREERRRNERDRKRSHRDHCSSSSCRNHARKRVDA